MSSIQHYESILRLAVNHGHLNYDLMPDEWAQELAWSKWAILPRQQMDQILSEIDTEQLCKALSVHNFERVEEILRFNLEHYFKNNKSAEWCSIQDDLDRVTL